MKAVSPFLALCVSVAITCLLSNKLVADELDVRLAALERENAILKKRLRIEALENENVQLSRKLTSANVSRTTEKSLEAARPRLSGDVRPEARDSNAMLARSGDTRHLAYDSSRRAFDETRTGRWDGSYIGAHGGSGFGVWSTSLSNSISGGFNPPPATNLKQKPFGAIIGLQAGYLWQNGQIVFGPELDFGASTLNSKRTLTGSYNAGGFTNVFVANTEVGLNWMSSIRGRIGVASNEWLFFVTGGLALAGLDAQSTFSFPNIAASKLAVGFAAGGGLAYAFSDAVSLRAEYLYYGFSTTSSAQQIYTNFGTPSTSNSMIDVRPSTNVVRVGIDWRFNSVN